MDKQEILDIIRSNPRWGRDLLYNRNTSKYCDIGWLLHAGFGVKAKDMDGQDMFIGSTGVLNFLAEKTDLPSDLFDQIMELNDNAKDFTHNIAAVKLLLNTNDFHRAKMVARGFTTR